MLDFYPYQYFRYVDDTLCFFSSPEHVERFLNHINEFHESIHFTVERSTNNAIPFLDVKISYSNGTISTQVYRKPTYTGRLLHFRSMIPKVWKSGLIKGFIHRAFHLSSDWMLFHNEINQIRDILTFNGYPHWWLERAVRNFLNTELAGGGKKEMLEDQSKNYDVIKLPYYGQCSLSLKRSINKILRKIHNKKTKVVFTSQRLRSIFPLKQRDKLPLQSSLVYKFACLGDPSIFYIGETARQLTRRVRDHINTNTAISNHLRHCSRCPSNLEQVTHQFTVLKKSDNHFDREIKEALLIRQLQPSLNIQHTSGKQAYTLGLF